MKFSFLLILMFTASQLLATPTKQIKKWKLFAQLDEITDELNSSDHSDKQVDTSLSVLINTLNTLRGTTPTELAKIEFKHPNPYVVGKLVKGAEFDFPIHIENTGSFAASSIIVSGIKRPFQFKGGSFPGTGGTCASTLSPNSNCILMLSTKADSFGQKNNELNIEYYNGLEVAAEELTIKYEVVTKALLVSAPVNYDFLEVATGGKVTATFTVTNTGFATASSLKFYALEEPYSFKNQTHTNTGTCKYYLMSGDSCYFEVQFSPTASGELATDAIAISYWNGLTKAQDAISLTGAGISPALLTISDTDPYDYGFVAVGGTTKHIFTVTNTGESIASALSSVLPSPFSYAGGTFPGTFGTCKDSLAPATTCDIEISFTPTSPGSMADTITLNYFDGANPQVTTRNLAGHAVSRALLTISEVDSYDYGVTSIGSINDHTFYIKNSGSYPATNINVTGLSEPFHFKADTYPGAGGTCPKIISPLVTCSIVVTYAPTKMGVHYGSFTFNYFDGADASSATRTISGIATAPALLQIGGVAPYNFGIVAINGSVTTIFTITNVGSVDASQINELSLAAPFSFAGNGTYPGGGTCTPYIAPGTSCTIVVEYSPTTTGLHISAIDLNYFTGTSTTSLTKSLEGTGATPANLVMSDGPSYDFGIQPTGSSVNHTFTITNKGGTSASSIAGGGLAQPFSYSAGSYPGTGGDCSEQLAPAATCNIVVEYAPTSTGINSDSIAIDYFDGVSGQSLNREVVAVATLPAIMTISESDPYDYGSVPVGGSSLHTFTISNVGGYLANSLSGSVISSQFTFDGGAFPGISGTCGVTLSPGSSCTFVVRFASSSSGTFSDSITINFDDGVFTSQTISRNIIGYSESPAKLSFSGLNTYNFGTIVNGEVTTNTFYVTNNGDFTAHGMTAISLFPPFEFKGGDYPGSGGTCRLSLAPAETCTIAVNFSPISTGAFAESLELNYDNGVKIVSTKVNMVGTSMGPANLTISEGPVYDYGTIAVNSLTEKTFKITNSGSHTATSMGGTLVAPFRYKDGPYPGTGGDCGMTLNSAQSCTVVVTYEPTSAGTNTEDITINYFDGAVPQITVRSIMGTGVNSASLTISEAGTFSYGDVAVGSFSDHTFTITNTGDYSATAITGIAFINEFRFKGRGSFPGNGGTCTSTISPGAHCTIVIEFFPSSTGNQVDSITINYNDGVGANSVSRQVDGDGRVPAQLSISHLDPYNFGVIPVGSSTYETFIVTNTGNYTASSIGSVFSINDPFQFRGSGYPGLGGDCTISLVPGATCRLVVKFSPTYPGYSFDHLELDYNNGAYATTETKEVSGTGVGPAVITISETDTFSYGSRPIGSVTSHSFTITNSGSHKAINIKGLIQAPFEFSGGTFPGGTGSCPNDGTLDFGRSCTVSIDFKPVANATSLGEFKLTYQNGSSKQSVSRLVEGTGIDALPPVSPGNWSWQFIGIENGSTSSDNTPLLAAKNIDSSQLSNTISFYTNSTCVNATSVETITGTSLTQYFIFRSDGRDDGRKNFYVKVTDKNGYESTCDYVANYTLDTINLAPTNKKMKTTLLNKWTQAN